MEYMLFVSPYLNHAINKDEIKYLLNICILMMK